MELGPEVLEATVQGQRQQQQSAHRQPQEQGDTRGTGPARRWGQRGRVSLMPQQDAGLPPPCGAGWQEVVGRALWLCPSGWGPGADSIVPMGVEVPQPCLVLWGGCSKVAWGWGHRALHAGVGGVGEGLGRQGQGPLGRRDEGPWGGQACMGSCGGRVSAENLPLAMAVGSLPAMSGKESIEWVPRWGHAEPAPHPQASHLTCPPKGP